MGELTDRPPPADRDAVGPPAAPGTAVPPADRDAVGPPAAPGTVLLLGGTGEARRLATLLAGRSGPRVVTSLAGRVARPALPPGEVRIGGFGGPRGLADWLRAEGVDAVIDATHPFAARITASAVAATAEVGVPLLVLRRPGWTAGPGDDWRRVPSVEAAARALAEPGRPPIRQREEGPGNRVFLTIGRQGLAVFADLDRHWFLIRSVEPPHPPLPPRAELLLDRGPFTVDGELELMRRHRIDVLVTKDSGGEMTAAKLGAARRLGRPVIVVDRPALPPVPQVATVEAALAWLSAGDHPNPSGSG